MDIGTGKDIPKNFDFKKSRSSWKKNKIGYYTNGKVRIWGYDLVSPDENFSVSKYLKIVQVILKDIYLRSNLPIIVGGTGLYIKAIVDGLDTIDVPKKDKLRKNLNDKGADELFEILAMVDPVKAASLNQSDKKNPRRLIRAIEVAQYRLIKNRPVERKKYDVLMIGLKASKEMLFSRVEKRVEERLDNGIENELESLLDSGLKWSDQSMNTLGYKEWVGYFNKYKKKEEVINEWIKDEKKYIKSQLTWFKKDKRITWFNINDNNLISSVEKRVKEWYKMN
jgi:tRNA dimethylallyltransferase